MDVKKLARIIMNGVLGFKLNKYPARVSVGRFMSEGT